MAIVRVSRIEEWIDIVAEDHPWRLILLTILTAGLLGVGFYFRFWPVISGQPEYTAIQVLSAPQTGYDVFMIPPKRVEPNQKYDLWIKITQNTVLTTTQQITISVKPLSPFARLASGSQDEILDIKSFKALALTSKPQEFEHLVVIKILRPADRLRYLPFQLSLGYDNGTVYTQEIGLEIDYWSRPIAFLITSGAAAVFISFAVRVAKSLLGR